MDPLSVVASVLAVAQAGDKLIQLVSRIRLYSNAPEEIDALINEVSDLRLVLNTMHTTASNLPQAYVIGLGKGLDACSTIVLELERTLNDLSTTPSKANSRWLKRRNKVES
jgi:hypothetical protein